MESTLQMDIRSAKMSQSCNRLSEELSSTQNMPSNESIPNKSIATVQSESQSSQSSIHSSRHGSQVVYTPRLKKVLKSYQASATTSLNGPDWVPNRVCSASSPSSSSSSMSSSMSSPLSSLSSLPVIATPPMALQSGNDSKGWPLLSSSRVNILDKNKLSNKQSYPLSRSTISTINRYGEQSSQSSLNRSKNSNIASNGTKGDSYDPFLAPPPFPIQQPPIFTPPDQNRCERSETILEGETISCFTVGGEKRLCLPQILTTVLREFSLPQINSVCDELQIFCSRCTNDQLEVLKLTGIIPASAPSCGLITKTDAERLCATLLYSNPPKSAFSNTNGVNGKQLFTIKVYHECFGKCIGLYVPSLYVQPFSTCIECLECHGLFAPQKFVCHSHRSKENRTCHWGFDSSNWRAYLLLSKDNRSRVEKAINDTPYNTDIEQHLLEMKSRFDFKRKIPVTLRDENQTCDPLKRLKSEETCSPSSLYSYPSYLFSPYGWATDPSLLMYWYSSPALGSGASSNSATTLAARLSAFKPWSASAIGNGKHLSQNISQVMPQGFNSNLQTHKLSSEPPLLQNPEKIAFKRLDRYIEPNVGLAPLNTTLDTTASIAQKAFKSNDKLKSSIDRVQYDEDSFSSNNTFSSENSNLSDEESSSSKAKSAKIFSNLEVILEENKLSQELKLKIINEVENIINKLANTEPQNHLTLTSHKNKILNGIETNKINQNYKTSSLSGLKSDQNYKTNSLSGLKSDQIEKDCMDGIGETGPSLMPVVSVQCSPSLIKREPNTSPLMADPKINCVH